MKQAYNFTWQSARMVLAVSILIFFCTAIFLLSAHYAFTEEWQVSDVPGLLVTEVAPEVRPSTPSASERSVRQRRDRDAFFAEQIQGKRNVTIISASDSDFLASMSDPASTDLISDVTFYFHVSNPTNDKLSLLTIPTGIREGTLNYIRIEGATGYKWRDGQLVIAYVSLPPGGSATVSVTGLPLISVEPVTIVISPTVRSEDGVLLAKNVSSHHIIAGKRPDIVANFHMGTVKAASLPVSQ